MPSFEDYLANADVLAQEVVNAWGSNMRAGNAEFLTPEFMDVFDKACRFQEVKQPADFYQVRNALRSDEGRQALGAEETARRVFIETAVKLTRAEAGGRPLKEAAHQVLEARKLVKRLKLQHAEMSRTILALEGLPEKDSRGPKPSRRTRSK